MRPMRTIEEVDVLLKAEVLQKEVRLRQVLFGAKLHGQTYVQKLDCQCILGCYLLGKDSLARRIPGYPSAGVYMDDAARHLGINASAACDIMLGFDSYPKDYKNHRPWADLGWRIAEWADELGILERAE